MVRRDYFAHTSPSGETLQGPACARPATASPARAGGRARTSAGAPAARATPNALVTPGSASAGHRRILLGGRNYRELGVGVAGGAPNTDGSLPGATYTMNVGVTGTR